MWKEIWGCPKHLQKGKKCIVEHSEKYKRGDRKKIKPEK